MPCNPKSKPADLPAIPPELLASFGNGPMTAEAINAASLAFKKALIERAFGGELNVSARQTHIERRSCPGSVHHFLKRTPKAGHQP